MQAFLPQDPILRTYLILILIILAAAGGILTLISVVFKKKISNVWRIYRGWLIMIPIAIACLWGGRIPTIVGITLLSLAGFREFARGTGLHRHWAMTGLVYLGICALGVTSLTPDPRLHVQGWYGLFMALPVYVVASIFTVPVIANRHKGQLQSTALAITGFIYFGWMFGHLAFLANAGDALGYFLFLMFAVEINDVAAFVCGKFFGKHKLREHISPNKTVEGSVGALLVSLAMPFLLSFSLPNFQFGHLLLTGLIVGIGGQLGDLTLSFIKRDVGIKDMGSVIPGHGGILDRVDSMIYVAPLFFHMIRWFFDIQAGPT